MWYKSRHVCADKKTKQQQQRAQYRRGKKVPEPTRGSRAAKEKTWTAKIDGEFIKALLIMIFF